MEYTPRSHTSMVSLWSDHGYLFLKRPFFYIFIFFVDGKMFLDSVAGTFHYAYKSISTLTTAAKVMGGSLESNEKLPRNKGPLLHISPHFHYYNVYEKVFFSCSLCICNVLFLLYTTSTLYHPKDYTEARKALAT